MGAILSVFGHSSDRVLENRLRQMVARSPHRGEETVYKSPNLAIAVQSLGWDASMARGESAVVGFHGFVGNWDELRASHGLVVGANTDHAEVIATAYERLGEEIISLLRGEFALVIHDLRRNRVHAARDAVGCRPLYLQQTDEYTVLATEIRQVVAGVGGPPKLNERALVAHLVNLPQKDDDTLFSDVHCVIPGDVYTFAVSGDRVAFNRRAYWCLGESEPANHLAEDEWVAELAFRFKRSVRRWIPNQSSGLTLSGGLDSSAVWAQLGELSDEGVRSAEMVRPISLFFPGLECDERRHVEKILAPAVQQALGIDGTVESLTSLRPKLLECLDTISFRTTFFLYLIARAASIDGRKTVMTGYLGDHWFDIRASDARKRAGRGVRLVMHQVLGSWLASRAYPALRGQTMNRDLNSVYTWLGRSWRGFVKERVWERALDGFGSKQVISRSLNYERTGWSLQSWEQIGAVFGVEYRHPFSDPDLVGFSSTVPDSLRGRGMTKLALRRILASKLPAAIVQRSDKTIFKCLVQRCEPSLALELSPGDWNLVDRGIVDPSALDKLIAEANTCKGEALRTVLWLEEVEAFVRSIVN